MIFRDPKAPSTDKMRCHMSFATSCFTIFCGSQDCEVKTCKTGQNCIHVFFRGFMPELVASMPRAAKLHRNFTTRHLFCHLIKPDFNRCLRSFHPKGLLENKCKNGQVAWLKINPPSHERWNSIAILVYRRVRTPFFSNHQILTYSQWWVAERKTNTLFLLKCPW